MISEQPIVYVVDDDTRIREALCELLAAHGMRAMAFASLREYINSDKPDAPACMVLDIELSDAKALGLQCETMDGLHPPIVFLSGRANVSLSSRATPYGAVHFLTKPFNDRDLMNAIRAGISEHRKKRVGCPEVEALKRRYLRLTQREREVFDILISGLSSKQGAQLLGNSEVTFANHMRKVMQKMEASSIANLIQTAERLEIPYAHSRRPGLHAGGPLQKGVVAVVDNDQRLLESLQDLLESEGYAVRTFPSAERLLANGVFALDLLITDISMPQMDGVTLRDVVYKLRPELPVFLMSGRHEYSAQGIPNCFRKPFDAKALLAAIDRALNVGVVEVRYEE